MTTQLTYKIPIRRQFLRYKTKKKVKEWYKWKRKIRKYLRVAKRIANWVIDPKRKFEKITTKDTKALGKIPSAIANQVIRKYKFNKTIKEAKNVNLIVPSCHTSKSPSIRHEGKVLKIIPLKLTLNWVSPVDYVKISQAEVDTKFVYITVTVTEQEKKNYKKMVGVDLNIKHNLATVGEPKKGKHKYLGKDYIYKRIKYREIRKRFQKQGRVWKVKEMGSKEQRLINDLTHKMSAKIVEFARKRKGNIALEDLTDIRKTGSSKSFRYFLNSWPFYKLRLFIDYKSQAAGIKMVVVDPRYTSQDCSSCGERTKTKGKWYKCSFCKMEMHRDKNACFNISKRGKDVYKSLISED